MSKKYKMPYQPTLFETQQPYFNPDKSKTNGKIFILDRDINGDNRIDINDLKWDYLEGVTPADLPIKEEKKARRFCKTETVMCPYNWKNFCYYEGVCDGNMEYLNEEEN